MIRAELDLVVLPVRSLSPRILLLVSFFLRRTLVTSAEARLMSFDEFVHGALSSSRDLVRAWVP